MTADPRSSKSCVLPGQQFGLAVFVTISRLRRKLGDPPIIEIRPRAGYHITDSCRYDDSVARPGISSMIPGQALHGPNDLRKGRVSSEPV